MFAVQGLECLVMYIVATIACVLKTEIWTYFHCVINYYLFLVMNIV